MTTSDSYADAELPPVPQPPRRIFVRGGTARPPTDPVTIRLPGSKYYTLRYLLVALLAEGESLVRNLALADDTAVLVRALRALFARLSDVPRDAQRGAVAARAARAHSRG